MFETASPVLVGPGQPAVQAGVRHRFSDQVIAGLALPRVMLQLPRVADGDGLAEPAAVVAEIEGVAQQLERDTETLRRWLETPERPVTLDELSVAAVSDEVAEPVLRHLHYLTSFRPGSRQIAVLARETPAALFTFSALDLATIAAVLPSELTPTDVLVLSRVFAFDWAPRNVISWGLARAVRLLREAPSPPRMLLTYLNPNVGFDGASYRAANWRLFAEEHGTRYAYLDARYITDRRLIEAFGTSEPASLRAELGSRVSWSRMRLAPLQLWALALERRLTYQLNAWTTASVPRPT